MPPIRTIAVLFHERNTDAEQANYRVWPLIANWRARGIRVDILFGPPPSGNIDADLLFPHIDLSYIPDAYWSVIDAHPKVVNRAMRDTRKRRISTNLVTRDDPYDGPVIVKTNNNCGGYGDAWIGPKRGPSLRTRVLARLGRNPRLAPYLYRWAETLNLYPIYDSIRQVPRSIFRNPNLVVEKFLPEREHGFDGQGRPVHLYVMRMWVIFGNRSLGRILHSTDPWVKTCYGARAQFTEAPTGLEAHRDRLGLDYGKLDFVIHNPPSAPPTPVLIDANITPTISGNHRDQFFYDQATPLSLGLEAFE